MLDDADLNADHRSSTGLKVGTVKVRAQTLASASAIWPRGPRGIFQIAKEGWLKTCASYPNLSGADLAVVIALSAYLNSKRGDAWPSIETLAEDVNRSRSTVSRSIERLEKAGRRTLLVVESLKRYAASLRAAKVKKHTPRKRNAK
jgi:hypothetical protein